MKLILLLIISTFLFYSCSIFKNNQEYYPDAYEEYYHIPFPYLHNYSNNLELKIISLKDTVILGVPLELMVKLSNKSKIDTIYYGYFDERYDFDLRNSDGEVYKSFMQLKAKYAMGDNIQTPRDKYGRPFTALFHSTKLLYPGDSLILFSEEFYYSAYNNKFTEGEYYLSCKINHMEFDSLYNPVETAINSNEIKFAISSRTKNKNGL